MWPRRSFITLGYSIAGVVFAAVVCAGSGSAAGWLPGRDLASVRYGFAAGAVAEDGTAIAVWTHLDPDNTSRPVLASVRPPFGDWEKPTTLGSGRGDPSVAVDPRGNAVAVWFDQTDATIKSSRRRGGSWEAAKRVSVADGTQVDIGSGPQVGLDGSGNAVAIWQARQASGNYVVEAANLPAGGNWGTPTDISTGASGPARLAVNSKGDAIAAWTRSTLSGGIVEAAIRSAGDSAWQPPQPIAATQPPSASGLEAIAINAAGDAVATWEVQLHVPLAATVIQASVLAAGTGRWDEPQTLSAAGDVTTSADVTLDAAGNADVVWTAFRGGEYVVDSASRPTQSTSWQQPQEIVHGGKADTMRPDRLVLRVAANSAGRAVALWRRTDGVIDSASRASSKAPWEGPSFLADPSGAYGKPQVGIDASGDAVAIWAQGPDPSSVLDWSPLDVTPPTLDGLSVPRSVTKGTSATFTVAPRDAFSALDGLPVWTFGDGASATGLSVQHTYATTLTFSVSVTQRDAAGNIASASRSVTVSATPAPVNVSPPRILGAPLVGKILRADPGRWLGTPAPTYSYSWEHCDSHAFECAPIRGASTQSFVVPRGFEATTLRLTVTATNAGGSTRASTVPTNPVAGALRNIRRPAVVGRASVGKVVRCVPGSWSALPISYSYRWVRGGRPLRATRATLRLQRADGDRLIACRVTARSPAGTAVATSRPVRVRSR